MKTIFNRILVALIIVLFATSSACKNRKGSGQIAPRAVEDSYSVNGIELEKFQELLEIVDHIDIIFNMSDASMNIDGRQGVYQDLQYISSKPLPEIPEKCYPVARKIYLSNGEIVMEGDLYNGRDCNFQIFILNNKELYGNYLTTQGAIYAEELLKQVAAGPPPGYQG